MDHGEAPPRFRDIPPVADRGRLPGEPLGSTSEDLLAARTRTNAAASRATGKVGRPRALLRGRQFTPSETQINLKGTTHGFALVRRGGNFPDGIGPGIWRLVFARVIRPWPRRRAMVAVVAYGGIDTGADSATRLRWLAAYGFLPRVFNGGYGLGWRHAWIWRHGLGYGGYGYRYRYYGGYGTAMLSSLRTSNGYGRDRRTDEAGSWHRLSAGAIGRG